VREQLTPERLGILGESGAIRHGSHRAVEGGSDSASARDGRDTPAGLAPMSMPSIVILSHVIGFNHADLAGAEKESLSSAALLRTSSRPCKAPLAV
jgi:hypothetical protein